jgi:L,D-transpeptidase catalytic domain
MILVFSWGTRLRTDCARHECASRRGGQITSIPPGIGYVLGLVVALGMALVLGLSPAQAEHKIKHKVWHRETPRANKEPFGDVPKGPLQIFISIDQQKLHLYSDGIHVADAPVATGVPSHPTPMGVFSVIQKQRFHRSNIYSNAPMPFMQRITWSGVAMHEGPGVGHVASHGCIRMPHDFAARLWVFTRLGARVIIARPELRPIAFADPHLFVHKDRPPILAAARPAAVQTAQFIDASKRTDAAGPPVLPGSTGLLRRSDPPTIAAPVGAVAGAVSGGATPEQAVRSPLDSAVASATAQPVPGPARAPASAPALDTVKPAAPTPAALAPSAADAAPSAFGPLEDVPLPLPKPSQIAKAASGGPIAIFISRKTGKIYVRQNFAPLFEAPVTIANRDQPLGTHVFTAMKYLGDGSSFRWTVVSLPGGQPKTARKWIVVKKMTKYGRAIWRREVAKPIAESSPETPQQALARIEIPQDVVAQISELIVPGSSLIVSDHGLGAETGRGTGFIVITH